MPLVYRKCKDDLWSLVLNRAIKVEQCDNSTSFYDPYKLHVSIHREVVLAPEVEEALRKKLDEALENQIITGYKYLTPEKRKKYTFRNTHLPYVIYLHPTFSKQNLTELLVLCQAIENLLPDDVRPACKGVLHECDLPISARLTFRQSSRNGKKEYISLPEQPELDETLKEQGEKSEYYKYLVAGLAPQSKMWRLLGVCVSKTTGILGKIFNCRRSPVRATDENIAADPYQTWGSKQKILSSNAGLMRRIGGVVVGTPSANDAELEVKDSLAQHALPKDVCDEVRVQLELRLSN